MIAVNPCSDWFVLYTRFNFERQIHKNAELQGLTTYLPTFSTIRQWKDRKKRLDLPLFPNYLFVQGGPLDINKVLLLKGAIQFVMRDGNPAIVQQSEIEKIRKVELGNPEVTSDTFEEGDYIEIERGPLKGLGGKIIKVKGKLRLGVEIEIINKYVLVDVSPSDVKTIRIPELVC
jgi:transcriptional antiterminator RfaH